ncbi:MAG: hypothetical protein R3217_04170 [Gammaproteobacteria bacterium]|nr:hypothetical protein [Gammaproteobacteria bacterium]
MLRRFRKKLPHISRDQGFELLLEFIAIVIGVMIALAVDEWREEREIAESNDIAIARLNEEVRQNHEELLESLQIVSRRFEALAGLRVTADSPFREHFRDFGGFDFPDLNDSVWQRLLNDRWANRISASYVDEAALLYHRIGQLRELEKEMNHHTFGESFHDAASVEMAHSISRELMLKQIVLMREAVAMHEVFMERNIPAEPDR